MGGERWVQIQHTKAIQKTEKHRAAVMMASLGPEGYSSSSVGLSSARASLRPVVSNLEALLAAEATRARVLGLSSWSSFFSSRSELDALVAVAGGTFEVSATSPVSGVVEDGFDLENGSFMMYYSSHSIKG